MKKIILFVVLLLGAYACAFSQQNIKIDSLKNKLDNHSLLVYNNNKIEFQDERGIQPLLIQINKNGLEGAIVVDKVIGKAAALLMVYGKVAEVHTDIIAKDAITVFEKYKIKYSYNTVVPYILNINKDGLCPMEQAVKNIDDPESAYKCFNK